MIVFVEIKHAYQYYQSYQRTALFYIKIYFTTGDYHNHLIQLFYRKVYNFRLFSLTVILKKIKEYLEEEY